MALVSFGRLRDLARSSFWLVPGLCTLVSIGLAIGLVRVDELVGDLGSAFLFPGPPEGARSLLGAIISAMISFTGLVFSITVVVLVLTSGQFSPRVLRGFLRDRTIQWSLGTFVATFVYAMTVIREVLGTDGNNAFVPRIAVTSAFVLVLASVGLFIGYIDHVANMIRASTIIAGVGAETRGLLERRCPADLPDPRAGPGPAGPAAVLGSPRSGVVTSVNERAIARAASAADRVVELVPRVGDFVPAGAPLFRVRGGDPPEAGWLHGCVGFARERTMEQDVAFGFRQLVDIAERALSPGINDPTTASQAIDLLHDLLRRLATRRLPSGLVTDGADRVRFVVPQYAFSDYLDLGVAEIWHYGRDGMQIPCRLASMLRDLDDAALPENRPAIRRWLRTVTTRVPTA